MIQRVSVTAEASTIIKQLRRTYGNIIFHISGGCCDGSAPSCLPSFDFIINETDVFLGRVDKCNFYISKKHFEYMKYSRLILDIIHGKGSAFSLEIPLGYRFITRSHIVDDEKQLSPILTLKTSGEIPEL
jgi:uncharacterized protein (DUF779 family)